MRHGEAKQRLGQMKRIQKEYRRRFGAPEDR
jgi:hypothetical protein